MTTEERNAERRAIVLKMREALTRGDFDAQAQYLALAKKLEELEKGNRDEFIDGATGQTAG